MTLGITIRDEFGYCIICRASKGRECGCGNYIGDAYALTNALSAQGVCLRELHSYISFSKEIMAQFDGAIQYKNFFNPYVAAIDFLIQAGKCFKDYQRVEVVRKNGYDSNPHKQMLPVMMEYLRDLVEDGSRRRTYISEYGAKTILASINVALVPESKKFEDVTVPIRKSNYLAYNIGLHIRSKMFSKPNQWFRDENFKAAFVEVFFEVHSKDIQLTRKYATALADMFCYSRGLYKDGKSALNPKGKSLTNDYSRQYKLLSNSKQYDEETGRLAELYTLLEY